MLNSSLKHDLDEELDDTVEDITKNDDGERIVVSPNAHVPVFNLHPDLKTLLFSYLSPMDAAKAAFVSQGFKAMVDHPNVWREYLNRYFPHIVAHKPHEFENNPKALFISLYRTLAKGLRIQNAMDPWTPAICRLYLLDALRGDIPEMETIFSNPKVVEIMAQISTRNGGDLVRAPENVISNVKHRLAVVAQANGCPGITIEGELWTVNRFLRDALPALLGNFAALKPPTPDTGSAIIWGLAANGCLENEATRLNVIGNAEQFIQFLRHDGMNTLAIAAFGGHLGSVNLILSLGQRIHRAGKIYAAAEAARQGHWHVLQALMADLEIEKPLSSSGLSDILTACAEYGRLEIIKNLLERDDISYQTKCQTLSCAKAKGHDAIVSFLLENHLQEFNLFEVFYYEGIGNGFKEFSARIAQGIQSLYPFDNGEAQSMEVEPIENDLPMLNDVSLVEEAPVLMLSQSIQRLSLEDRTETPVQMKAQRCSVIKRK